MYKNWSSYLNFGPKMVVWPQCSA